MKKVLLALALVSSTSSFAADVSPLINAVNDTQKVVVELQQLINSGALGANTGGGTTPTPVPTPSRPSGETVPGCSFCDEEATVEEGDVNLALNILGQVGGDLDFARQHLSQYAQGISINFNFSFGCSYSGDAAIDLASADLALGFPQNTNAQWRTRVDTQTAKLKQARVLAGCP